MKENDLREYFDKNTQRCISKWMHYFEIYDRHFARFRGTDVHVLEIGVSNGGSLQMWKHYFGEQAHIYGVDINPHCKALEEDHIKIFIGDQADRSFLSQLKSEIPRIDIVIDDGGHFASQQIATFVALYPEITNEGLYLCEDLHTAYWMKGYGGGVKRRGTFIEYSKNLIDELNAWHYKNDENIQDFTKSTYAIHFYDSILVIEKKLHPKPESRESGRLKISDHTIKFSPLEKLMRRFKRLFTAS